MSMVPASPYVSAIRYIFGRCIEVVDPGRLIQSRVIRDGRNSLKIHDLALTLQENCYVIGFGKATYKMAIELENILDHHLQEGIISIPKGSLELQNTRLKSESRIRVFEGAKNNLPDEDAFKAAERIKSLAEKCSKDHILFVLISGGGSALLPYPVPPITLSEKYETVKTMASGGADIVQLNAVRRALSQLKGGKLARLAYPANTIALILSDVVGDPLNVIAAGPTVISSENENERETAVDVLTELHLMDSVPESVKQVLRQNCYLKPRDYGTGDLSNWLHNIIIGNNATALAAAALEAKNLEYTPIIVSSRIAGQVPDIAKMYLELVTCICLSHSDSDLPSENFIDSLQKLQGLRDVIDGIDDLIQTVSSNFDLIKMCGRERKKLLLIGGGEPTVKVKGDGLGGRNQELALEMAVRIHEWKREENKEFRDKFDVVFASAGTDGIDGPTDAAGALSYTDLVDEALVDFELDPALHLRNNDSYSFFSKFSNGSCHIKIGHTGTNVMDVHFLIISPK